LVGSEMLVFLQIYQFITHRSQLTIQKQYVRSIIGAIISQIGAIMPIIGEIIALKSVKSFLKIVTLPVIMAQYCYGAIVEFTVF